MNSLCKSSDYKFAIKCAYVAHSRDVRVVGAACVPEGGIITGSRDSFVKVWVPDEECAYKEAHAFSGSSKFISSLCVLPSSAQYPNGLILAGSQDCSIYGFTPDSSEPVLRLLGHSDAVCSLSAGRFGTIVSGSWDKTARVWSGQQCVLVLYGHQQSVWATDVFPTQNLILTGSADHTIRLWRSGTCEKVFVGHEDCVRGLAVISEMKFLSCSNDCTVRLWQTSGQCLEIYKHHTDYIYSITLLSNGSDFATCGEDQKIKIWRNGKCIQSLLIASKTLWSITCLTNGDLAVGSSDGTVYVLGKVPADYFDEGDGDIGETGIHAVYDDLNLHPKDGINNIGNADGNGVSGTENHENLTRPGTYDGETVLCFDEQSNAVYNYEWNSASGTWIKKESVTKELIGDVTCGKLAEMTTKEKLPSEPPKKIKDYEFNVDVEGTMYKLAYNKGENPWDVAQKFVADHGLLTEHVGQVAEYIIQNTDSTDCNEYFPVKKYLIYVNANVVGLRAKLLEFCEHGPKEQQISPAKIDDLMLLVNFPEKVTHEQMAALDNAIAWSDEFLFPALDLLRLAVRCKDIYSKVINQAFINNLLRIFISTKKSVNRLLIVKIFCNLFGCEEGEKALLDSQEKICETVKEVMCLYEQSIQKAGTSLFLNYAIAGFNGMALQLNLYCPNMIEILSFLVDPDAIYRALVAIGTICTRDSLATGYFKSLNIKQFLLKFRDNITDLKVNGVLNILIKYFD